MAGAYSFSDELGGFRITSASGIGTKETRSSSPKSSIRRHPVTLTIRTTKPIQPFGTAAAIAQTGLMYMRVDVLNNSGQAWVEFQFELQEILHAAEHVRRRPVVRPAQQNA